MHLSATSNSTPTPDSKANWTPSHGGCMEDQLTASEMDCTQWQEPKNSPTTSTFFQCAGIVPVTLRYYCWLILLYKNMQNGGKL